MTNLAEVLGHQGPGLRLKDNVDFDKFIRKGIPFTAIEQLKKKLKLTDSEIADALGLSLRTLNRQRKAGGRLSIVASDRLFRIAKIYSFAIEVLEDEDKATEWLHNEQIGLGGRTPFDMMHTAAGEKEVEDLLGRIEYGVLS